MIKLNKFIFYMILLLPITLRAELLTSEVITQISNQMRSGWIGQRIDSITTVSDFKINLIGERLYIKIDYDISIDFDKTRRKKSELDIWLNQASRDKAKDACKYWGNIPNKVDNVKYVIFSSTYNFSDDFEVTSPQWNCTEL
ncbi:hypothetical protein [Photobacterium damselae]|uniref:Uncharacterized protein n=1 Tax=Photobacterium damselae subsp. damselae TaxID=85581 RepID=A0AAD3WTB4_PHODD|nr:hypothetical protein [Photobacterium damselae]KAB1176195.1 hypothetical protein F6450_18360 [Photobacterium damselae subsp. damselae]